jgi:hypothetical protein
MDREKPVSYSEENGQVVLRLGVQEYFDLLRELGARAGSPTLQSPLNMMAALQFAENKSPAVTEALSKMPADVQGVIADFEKDYLTAMRNFKEAYVSMLGWAMRARDELQMMKSYLEAEKLREQLGLNLSEIPEEKKS